MAKNYTLRNILFPWYLKATCFAAGTIGTPYLLTNYAKLEKELCLEGIRCDHKISIYALGVFATLVFMCACMHCAIGFPMAAKRKMEKLVQKYLRDMMVKYPELKQYESVLRDGHAMQNIAATICNGLTTQESNKIFIVAQQYEKIHDRSEPENQSKIKELDNQIIDIAKKHMDNHPEYMADILDCLKNYHTTYFMNKNQNVR